MLRPRFSSALLTAGLLPLLVVTPACSSSTGTTTTLVPLTAIVVDPQEFLDGVACLNEPGAMRLYVATLFDVSRFSQPAVPIEELALPSSAPTACFRAVEFQRITVGRSYVAHVEGYDVPDLTPLAPGSPRMVDPSGAYVAPKWETWCGGRPPSAAGGADDGTAGPDAGSAVTDGGSRIPASSTLDGGYLDCPRKSHPDGSAPPPGPVCAVDEFTITVRGCEPLHVLR